MLFNTPEPILLAIEPGDLALVHDALTLQACTEIMCGRRQAKERLEILMGQLAANIPACAHAFDGGTWAIIAAVAQAGGSFQVSIQSPSWNTYAREGYITVQIGTASWRSKDCRHKLDSPIAGEIRDYLNSIS